MAGGCKAAIGCVDARVPVRASYVSLYKWPESDAEFAKSVAMARRHQGDQSPAGTPSYNHHHHYNSYYNGSASMRRSGELFLPAAAGAGYACSPRVVDSYSCRQMYLRSYTFSKKKETVPERTMACLGRVRERAAVFPFLPNRGGGASDAGSVGSSSNSIATGASGRDDTGLRGGRKQQARRKRRKKKKGCTVARRLQEASCAIFRRLLACTTSVDVAAPSSAR